jgi:hypothetical protein
MTAMGAAWRPRWPAAPEPAAVRGEAGAGHVVGRRWTSTVAQATGMWTCIEAAGAAARRMTTLTPWRRRPPVAVHAPPPLQCDFRTSVSVLVGWLGE